MVHSLDELLSRYPALEEREKAWTRERLGATDFVRLGQLLARAETASGLCWAWATDDQLRSAFQAQARQQLLFAGLGVAKLTSLFLVR